VIGALASRRLVLVGASTLVASAALVGAGPAAARGGISFAPPSFVDQVKAGGEPGIIHSSKFGNLIYTSHEGTTHVDREGAVGSSIQQFLCPGLTTAENCNKDSTKVN